MEIKPKGGLRTRTEFTRALRDIADCMQTKQFVAAFVVTFVLLIVSFISYTRFTETSIMWAGQARIIHISYHGYPLEMIGIYSPLGNDEMLYMAYAGEGTIKVLWGGLALNFALFFAASFFLVYLIVRVRERIE